MTSLEDFDKQIEQSNFPTKNTQEWVFVPPIGPMPKMPAWDGRNIGVVSIPPPIGSKESPTDGIPSKPIVDPAREATWNPVTFPQTLQQHQGNCAQSIWQICNIGPNATVGGTITPSRSGSIRIGTER
jgi:hypothetical protein